MPIEFKPMFVEPAKEPSKMPSGKEIVGTATRVTGGMLPTLIRMGAAPAGTLAGGALGSVVPGAGTTLGALGGGALAGAAGETIAEWLEGSKWNPGRIAVEGAIGAVPLGKAPGILKGALKGTALAAGGIVGRKATDEDPNTSALDPNSYGLGDAVQLGIGGALGGVFGHFGGKAAASNIPKTIENATKAAKAAGREFSPPNATQFLAGQGLTKPETINTEITRLESFGDAANAEKANGLRIAARAAKKGNEQTYTAITKGREADAVQAAKNLQAASGIQPLDPNQLPSFDEIIAKGPKAVEEIAKRAEAQDLGEWAHQLREAAVQQGTSSPTTSNAVVRTKGKLNKASLEAKRRAAIDARKAELAAEGYTPQSGTVTESVSAPTELGGREGFSTRMVPPVEEADTEAAASGVTKTVRGKKAANAPQTSPGFTPKPTAAAGLPVEPTDKFQVVRGTTAVPFETEEEARRIAAELGPEAIVVPPKQVVPPVSVVPEAPITPKAPEVPFNAPRMAEDQAAIDEALPLSKIARDLGIDPHTGKPAPVAVPEAPPVAEAPAVLPEVPVAPEVTVAPPEAPVAEAPVLAEAPVKAKIKAKRAAAMKLAGPEKDIRERILTENPMSGRAEPAPGDIALPNDPLILQPKEGGGWDRTQVKGDKVVKSSTKNAKPPVLGIPKMPDEPLDLEKVRADLPNISDPKVKEMALRELGEAPPATNVAKAADAAPEVPAAAPAPEAEVINPDQSAYRQQVIKELENTPIEGNDPTTIRRIIDFLSRENGGKGPAGGNEAGFIDPILAARIGLTIGGAAYGGVKDKDDPLRGAVLGGAAGFAAPSAVKGLSKLGQGSAAEAGEKIHPMDVVNNYQRFALLSGFPNLPINIAAPGGGAIMGSIERMLAGKLSGNREMVEEGSGGLKQLLSPSNYSGSAIKGYFDEAKQLISQADHGRGDMIGEGGPSWLSRIIQAPANLMTTGDTAARSMLQKGGIGEELAREMTSTSEPRYSATKAIANLPRTGGPAMRFLLPFAKTAANAFEGSLERTPVLGPLLGMNKAAGNPDMTASLGEIIARQGMGAAVSVAAFQLGKSIDPDNAKNYPIPALGMSLPITVALTNMGGQYGPLAAAAFAAGQAYQKSGSIPKSLVSGATHLASDLPLPTTDVVGKLAGGAANIAEGNPVNPKAPETGIAPIDAALKWIPNNFIPRAITQEAQAKQEGRPTIISFTPMFNER